MGLFNLRGNAGQPSGQSGDNSRTSTNPFRRSAAPVNASSSSAQATASKTQQSPFAPTAPSAVPQQAQPPPPASDPPPYHDWTVIPDTSTFPPPPSISHDESGTNNAERYEADRAHHWVKMNPLIFPHEPAPVHRALVRDGDLGLIQPTEYSGQITQVRPGVLNGSSRPQMKDACLLTSLPLYFAHSDSPAHTRVPKTIYFEVEFRATRRPGPMEESTLALGYCAVPYPPWRLPGWERGSLGVHSDDGRRYVNNSWGGKDFSAPFKAGDTIGIGVDFGLPDDPPEYSLDTSLPPPKMKAEVFLTRNGERDGSWNLHEELDHRDGPVDGLDGLFDLYGAIGIYGAVEFTAKFRRQDWLWRPR